jgi:hypothetical protein
LETGVAAIEPSDCGGAKVGEELFAGVGGSVGDKVIEGVGVKVLQLVLKIGCRAGGREVGVVPDGLGERASRVGLRGVSLRFRSSTRAWTQNLGRLEGM